MGNDRVLSVPLDQTAEKNVIGVAMAIARLRAVRGAMHGRLINGLNTNDPMTELLLETLGTGDPIRRHSPAYVVPRIVEPLRSFRRCTIDGMRSLITRAIL